MRVIDKDDPKNGHYFVYNLPSEMANNPNFTIKENEGKYFFYLYPIFNNNIINDNVGKSWKLYLLLCSWLRFANILNVLLCFTMNICL